MDNQDIDIQINEMDVPIRIIKPHIFTQEEVNNPEPETKEYKSPEIYSPVVLSASDRDHVLTQKEFDDLLEKTMKDRDEQDLVFSAAYKDDNVKLNIYKQIILKKECKDLKEQKPMLEQIYPGDLSKQGQFTCLSFINCTNVHGSNIIYGKKINGIIKNGLNQDMFKQINGTEVTVGMMKNAEGYKWQNGFIQCTKNSVLIRDQDNQYGQPGSMMCAYFYNKLGVKVFDKYVVPGLYELFKTHTVNHTHDDIDSNNLRLEPHIFMHFVTDTFKKIYDQKLELLESCGHEINEDKLFTDAPNSAIINHITIKTNDYVSFFRKPIRSLKNILKTVIITVRDTLNNALIKLE